MKHYYLCAYGHVARWSEKITSPNKAASYCFGLVSRVTVVDAGTRSPKYMTLKEKAELWEKLQ